MSALMDYVINHTERGACLCGQCIDAPPDPENHQPQGHTVDLFFFEVAKRNNPSADTLRQLIKEHKGEFINVDPLDGNEHNYIELGAWIGDQGLAIELMGLGELLGLWRVFTPKKLPFLPQELQQQMARSGMVTMRVV